MYNVLRTTCESYQCVYDSTSLKGLNIQYNNGHLLYDIKTAFANVSQHVQSICEELWSSLIRYQLLSMKPCIVFTINIFVSRYKSGLLVGTVRLPLEFQ